MTAIADMHPAPAQHMSVNVSPDAGQPFELNWKYPAWKYLQIFSIVHVIFEAVYIPLAFLTTIFGVTWPICVVIGAGNIACKCCCNKNGDKGKCLATTAVVMNSIALIGSFIDIAILGTLQAVCDDDDFGLSTHAYCQYITFTLSWCIICLILRFVAIVLAGRVCCGCCGGAFYGEQAAPVVAMVAVPAASHQVTYVATVQGVPSGSEK